VSSHKTPAVREWLEAHRRVSFHFTPTSASWMNQIETWFGILSRQAIRRDSFGSVKELIAMIAAFTAQWNEGSTPFAWVKTADQILAKAEAVSDRRIGALAAKPGPLEAPGLRPVPRVHGDPESDVFALDISAPRR
jgi:hypothetical protein